MMTTMSSSATTMAFSVVCRCLPATMSARNRCRSPRRSRLCAARWPAPDGNDVASIPDRRSCRSSRRSMLISNSDLAGAWRPGGATTVQLAKYVKFREEKFGAVLFETRSEKVFTLNPTATAVVREIQAGGDEGAITARLKERFDDRDGAIEREVVAFIADLRQRGLVEG